MFVNLRKADALSKSLLGAARAISMTTSVDISIYDNTTVEAEVVAAQNRLRANIIKAAHLMKASFDIRSAISEANAQHGINTLLNEKAAIDASEKMLSAIVSVAPANLYDEPVEDKSVSVAQSRLESLKVRAANSTDRYGLQEKVSVAVINDELAKALQDNLRTLRRRKIEIADQLLAINMTQQIELPETTITLLTENKLI